MVQANFFANEGLTQARNIPSLPESTGAPDMQAPALSTRRTPQRKKSDTSFATEGSRKKPQRKAKEKSVKDQSMELSSQMSERS